MWYVWGKLTETKSLPPAVLTDGDGGRDRERESEKVTNPIMNWWFFDAGRHSSEVIPQIVTRLYPW
jgi:hypothetical protein